MLTLDNILPDVIKNTHFGLPAFNSSGEGILSTRKDMARIDTPQDYAEGLCGSSKA